MYLIGTKFTLFNDHKALEILFSPKSKPTARIERWVLRLQQYDFTVKYRKGADNPADILSRMPISSSTTRLKVTGDPTRRFREIYHYSANFYPISLKFSPNIVR